MKQVYLLTGLPGSGKTSIIKHMLTGIRGKAGGFFTEEIRSGNTRQGFRLVTTYGQRTVLAHINSTSLQRVGKYGVNISNLEETGVPALLRAARDSDLVIIDEIGKMELLSDIFRESVIKIIDSGKTILGTIMLHSHPWADKLKLRPEVKTITVTRAGHNEVVDELSDWLKGISLLKSP